MRPLHFVALAAFCVPLPGQDAGNLQAYKDLAPTGQAAWTPATTIAAGLTHFSAELWRRLSAQGGTVACSPLSIYSALSMAACGARGRTLDEMERVIDVRASIADAQRWATLCDSLAPSMIGNRPAWTWALACGLFPRRDLPLEHAFVDCSRQQFHAAVEPQDFVDHSAEAIAAINGWTAQHTQGLIPSIVGPDSVTPATQLVLTSALCLSAAWQCEFQPADTSPAFFHSPGREDRMVATMHARMALGYGVVGAAQVVSLPYANGGVECILVVPQAANGLRALEQGLDAGRLDQLCAAPAHQRIVSLSLPRLDLRSGILPLGSVLRSMGMRDAFDPAQADFSAMSPGRLALGEVLHRAVISVCERGTTAAAVTAVTAYGAADIPDDPVALAVDHPFLLIIRHRQSGALLFLARVEDPGSELQPHVVPRAGP